MCNHEFPGKVCLPDPGLTHGEPVITLDASSGDVVIGGPAGGSGHRGQLVITDADANPIFSVDGATGHVSQRGDVVLLDSEGNERIRITGPGAEVVVKNAAGDPVVRLGGQGELEAGGGGQDGRLVLRDAADQDSIIMDGDEGDIAVQRQAGGLRREVLKFDASQAALHIGAQGNEGDIFVRNNAGQVSVRVDGNEGDIIVKREIAGTLREVLKFDASTAALTLGCEGNDGDLVVRDDAGKERIRLDGHTGDIRLRGADCAEQFEVADPETIEPGTVLVIDNESGLRPCDQAYDSKVAGVASGANGYSPGIVMDDSLAPGQRLALALNGKVYCKVDAGFSAIETGDLLTTSPALGHAMKATDPSQAFGAVIGKALGSLDRGCGLIPVLVSLQ